MRGTFFGIEIGRTGLTTAQFGLDVTSHNISNLDTAGYTRQRIVSTAYDPYAAIGRFAPVGHGKVGGGVRVQILDQIRSAYLDKRFRDESNTHSYWDTRAQRMQYIESFFDNVNEKTSINFTLAAFFESMMEVSKDPVAGAPRKLMQTSAMDLVQQLHMMYDGLVDLQKVENEAVRVKTNDINRIAAQIADLNVAIYTFEVTGMLANDLRDKRNLLVDQLSTIVDIEYEEYPDPDYPKHSLFRIRIAGSAADATPPEELVDHDSVRILSFATEPNPLDPDWELVHPIWEDSGVRLFSVNDGPVDRIKGGELRAHMDMRDNDFTSGGVDSRDKGIPYYIELLNNLARALVYAINEVHEQGWTDGPSGSETGIKFFFDDGSPITARNISLSEEIIASEYNIAASSKRIDRNAAPDQQQRGNNENIRALYALFNDTRIELPDGTFIGSFDEYATSIRFDVGATTNTAKQAAETRRILTLSANNQRTAIAGVSLDEEMVGLVRYNHAYNGAARVITAMDDALDRLINGTGRVGL